MSPYMSEDREGEEEMRHRASGGSSDVNGVSAGAAQVKATGVFPETRGHPTQQPANQAQPQSESATVETSTGTKPKCDNAF
ncbi:unnamed protein product [Merluccius merluccius]